MNKFSLQSLKQNLTQFTWNTLLYCLCNNKAKIWACCCCKAWIAWLCWAWICWFCIMSWLCCHSRASLSLFCSCKSSNLNSRSCSSFSRWKPTTSYLNFQLCCYPQCHYPLSSRPLRYHISPNLSIAFFFWFLEWAFFFSCSISDCLFWVSASVLPSLSSNLSVRSSRSYYFWLLVLLTSLRPRTVTANSSQLFKSYQLYCLLPDLLSSIPLFAIPLIIRVSFSLFDDMIDLRKGGNRFVYSLFKTLRRKAITRA